MKAIHVVFPVLRGTRRFFIEKGRRWSVIEHLLLDAVSGQPSSTTQLREKSGLPRRVIVEAFIRLMRAGWVEIVSTPDGPVFTATAQGAAKAELDQLPAATVVEPRWRSFAIEQITGGVFRSRELDVRPQSRVPFSTDDQIVVHLPGPQLHAEGDLGEVFSAIEGEDELIVGIDRSAERLTERFAVVTVREDLIEGLPARATVALKALVKARAAEAVELAKREQSAQTKPLPTLVVREPVEELPEAPSSKLALYESDDLIVDGPAHLAVLERTIRVAQERIMKHRCACVTPR